MKAMRLLLVTFLLSLAINAAPGDLDLTFDLDGKNVQAYNVFEESEALAFQNDGKIVVVGWTSNQNFTETDALATRFNTDGSLDTGFGTNGFTAVDFIGVRNWGFGMAIQADGKIIIAGTVIVDTDNNDIGLIRLTTDGNLDPSFGTNGKLLVDPFGGRESASDMALDSNGKIVVTGQWDTSMGVARFNSDGTYDNSFDGDGRKKINFPGSIVASANALTIDSGNNIFLTGSARVGTDIDFAVAKLLSNGSFDTSFSNDGLATFAMLTGGSDTANAIALDSNENIVLAGNVINASNDWAITKVDPTGSQIQSFGTDGKLIFDFGAADSANAVAIQSDNKILVGGSGNKQLQVGRFNPDGSTDNSFSSNSKKLWGTNGFATTDFYLPVTLSDGANALGIDSAGKIIAVGYGNNGANSDIGIARFLNNATNATISGRVLSSEKGRGVPNAIVHITEQNGNIITARTNHFGYFRFEALEAGQTLLLNTFHKSYQFNSQIINFDNSIIDLNITPQ